MDLPTYAITGLRPLMFIDTGKGPGRFAWDWDKGDFVPGDEYDFDSFHDSGGDTEYVTEAKFNAHVAKLRRQHAKKAAS